MKRQSQARVSVIIFIKISTGAERMNNCSAHTHEILMIITLTWSQQRVIATERIRCAGGMTKDCTNKGHLRAAVK